MVLDTVFEYNHVRPSWNPSILAYYRMTSLNEEYSALNAILISEEGLSVVKDIMMPVDACLPLESQEI